MLIALQEPYQAREENEARVLLGQALGVAESRTSGANRDKFVDILAGSKTVAWFDRHIQSLNLTDRLRGSKRDKVTGLLTEAMAGRIALSENA
eukprot:7651474-Alexandrium_andersonii.AAC.2